MTESLSPEDRVRADHKRIPASIWDIPPSGGADDFRCVACGEYWPCDAVRLLDRPATEGVSESAWEAGLRAMVDAATNDYELVDIADVRRLLAALDRERAHSARLAESAVALLIAVDNASMDAFLNAEDGAEVPEWLERLDAAADDARKVITPAALAADAPAAPPALDVERLTDALAVAMQVETWNIEGEAVNQRDRVHMDSMRSLAVVIAAEYAREAGGPDAEQCGHAGCPARAWSNGWCFGHQEEGGFGKPPTMP